VTVDARLRGGVLCAAVRTVGGVSRVDVNMMDNVEGGREAVGSWGQGRDTEWRRPRADIVEAKYKDIKI
jgi:hypothetical protein